MAKSKVVDFSDVSAYNQVLNELAKRSGLLSVKDNAESPIEKMLGYQLVLEAMVFKETFLIESIDVWCQDEFKFGSKVYRADLTLYIRNEQKDYVFIIECDGHEFHEKTKEQAKRDKSRDRAFMRNGFRVVRFTGSEIFNDTKACIEELFRIVEREVIPENLWIRNAWCED